MNLLILSIMKKTQSLSLISFQLYDLCMCTIRTMAYSGNKDFIFTQYQLQLESEHYTNKNKCFNKNDY